jgi:hypothetical protein
MLTLSCFRRWLVTATAETIQRTVRNTVKDGNQPTPGPRRHLNRTVEAEIDIEDCGRRNLESFLNLNLDRIFRFSV